MIILQPCSVIDDQLHGDTEKSWNVQEFLTPIDLMVSLIVTASAPQMLIIMFSF